MPYEHYKDGLTEAAASGEAPSGELRAHLDACAACRVAFAEEQQLFAAIDAGVRATANAEVPPSLIPTVRARLDENTAPRRRWILAPAMLACAAVLLITFVVVRVSRHMGPQKVGTPIQNAGKVAPPEIVPPREKSSAKTTPAVVMRAVHQHAPATHVARLDEPLVLVPPGQKEGVALLIMSLRRDEKNGEVLVAGARSQEFPNVQISPLSMSPLELKPLADLNGQQD